MTHVVLLKSNLACMGGLEKYTLALAEAFRQKNCKVTILTSGNIDKITADPSIQIQTIKLSGLFSFQRILKFDSFCKEFLERSKPSIIMGMDRNSHQTHIRAGNGSHVAFLKSRKLTDSAWTFRFNPLHRLILKIEKESFEHPDLKILFTNSFMVRDEILASYVVAPDKIKVVHNGVEWTEMQKDFDYWPDAKQKFSNEMVLDPKAFHFVFVGHNYRRKGLEALLKGLALWQEKNFILSIVGKDKNASYFESLARKLNLQNHVRFFGSRNDVRRFYQMADCLVIPSFYDPFANVTLEALAMGLFVVSSKTNGGHEILNPENGCIIEDLTDPNRVADALKIALLHRKTKESAEKIRMSVSHLDFSAQLNHIVDLCL